VNQLRISFLAVVFAGILLVLIGILLAPEAKKETGEGETPEAIVYQDQKNT
jgi:hypothetical protein